MNAITKKSLFLTFIFCFTLLGLQAQDERSLNTFDEISVIGNIEVVLQKGDQEKAVVYTENIPEEDVDINVSGGILKLRLLKSLQKDVKVKVELTYTSLRTIKGSAGAKISGNSDINSEILYLRAHSGAHLSLDIRTKELNAASYEGGVIKLGGKADSQSITASTGGQVKGLDLDCDRTRVKVNTGGQAKVVANQFLKATANTGGQIEYKGQPEDKSTKTLLSGKIKQV